MKTTYNFTKENNDQMLYKIECFENIFNSQTVIYLSWLTPCLSCEFLHVLRGMISDDRARTKYKYMEYASMKICYFRVRHVHDLSSPDHVTICFSSTQQLFI